METLLDQHPVVQYIRKKLHGITHTLSDKETVEIDNLCAVAKNLWNNLFFENGPLYAKIIVDLYCDSFKATVDHKKKKSAEIKEQQLKEVAEAFSKEKIEELEKQRIELEKGYKYSFSECGCFFCRAQNVYQLQKYMG